jgi:hypothetical protein
VKECRKLTFGRREKIFHFFDDTLDLLAGLFQLLFVTVQVLTKVGCVEQAIGEFESGQWSDSDHHFYVISEKLLRTQMI